jgi:hypothetical protein
MSRKKQRGKSKNKCKTLNMPYTVTFLDQKLYQSLSFDADMKFTDASEYVKKVWILKEYKKAGGDLDLTQREEEKPFSKTSSSYELQKSFKGDELVVELIQNIKFSDDFNYFAEAEIEETGDEELDKTLSEIKSSKFNVDRIRELFGLDKMDRRKFGDFKEPLPVSDPEEECSPDCDCDCE